jgi:hypothetical protein
MGRDWGIRSPETTLTCVRSEARRYPTPNLHGFGRGASLVGLLLPAVQGARELLRFGHMENGLVWKCGNPSSFSVQAVSWQV